MNKIGLWTAAVLLTGLLCMAETSTLRQAAVSRQGDQITLTLEAVGEPAYAAYPAEGGHYIIELSNTGLGASVPRHLEISGLDTPILIDAGKGSARLTLPFNSGVKLCDEMWITRCPRDTACPTRLSTCPR